MPMKLMKYNKGWRSLECLLLHKSLTDIVIVHILLLDSVAIPSEHLQFVVLPGNAGGWAKRLEKSPAQELVAVGREL
jgi:hypothetical protein